MLHILHIAAAISKGLFNWRKLFCFHVLVYAIEFHTIFFFSSCAALWILPAAWLQNTTSHLTGWTYALSATWLPTTAWAPCRDSVTVLCPTATFQRYCLKKWVAELDLRWGYKTCVINLWSGEKQGCSWLTLQDWHRLLCTNLSVWSYYHESTLMFKFLQGWIISRLL